MTVTELPGVAEAQALGLTEPEFARIGELLERDPNALELAVFSLLWSEHCAYKHSKKLLSKLPTEGERVLMGPGENAGAVDAGTGSRSPSRSRVTTTPRRSSPSRGPRPASAGSCATCSRSGRGRSPCSTRCASASSRASARATCSSGSSPGSPATATPLASRQSAATSTSRGPTSRTASSTRCASASRAPARWSARPPPAPATSSSCSAPAPVATVSAVPACWRRQSWTRPTRPNARACRSATRSRRTS